MDAFEYLRLLLDPDRLRIVGLLALEPRTADGIAKWTGVSRRDVLATLAPLVDRGIVVKHEDAAGEYWRSGGRVLGVKPG